jgi:hypothetical protein
MPSTLDCAMADALAEVIGQRQASGLPAWMQDGNRREIGNQSREGLAGRLGRSRPARARGISGETVKSAGAGETGGSGRSSEEGRDSITLPEQRTRGVQRRGQRRGLFRNVREGYQPGCTKGSGTRRHAKGRGKPGGDGGYAGSELNL